MNMVTSSKLKSLYKAEHPKPFVITDQDGLYISVSKKGKVSFFMRFRINYKQFRLPIGIYPAISLKEARLKVLENHNLLKQGINPCEEVKTSYNFKELALLWYGKYCVKNQKNYKQTLRRLEIHIFPKVEDREAGTIKLHVWLSILEDIQERVPSTAAMLLNDVKSIYSFAMRRELVDVNPLVSITPKRDLQITKNERDRVLSDHEIKMIFISYEQCGLKEKYWNTILFLLFYGCRLSELRLAKMEHFDFKDNLWTIPSENHKMGRRTKEPLYRPIIEEIKPVICRLHTLSGSGEYVLLGDRSKKIFPVPSLAMLPDFVNQKLTKHEMKPIEKWNVHSLRRTMRTNMSKCAAPHVAEKMLGHKMRGVWGVYDKYDYLEEQRQGYCKWFEMLQSIITS